MLKGNVQIGTDAGIGHHFEKGVGDLLGIAVEKADPGDSRSFQKLRQKEGQSVGAAAVPAESRGVLGDEDDFPRSPRFQEPGFGDYRGNGPGPVRSLDGGNGAERALMGTPLRNLEVRPSRGSRKQAGGPVIIEKRPGAGPERPVFRGPDDAVVIPHAQPSIDGGVALEKPRPVVFHGATRDDETDARPGRLNLQSPPDSFLGFLTGRADEAAGV